MRRFQGIPRDYDYRTFAGYFVCCKGNRNYARRWRSEGLQDDPAHRMRDRVAGCTRTGRKLGRKDFYAFDVSSFASSLGQSDTIRPDRPQASDPDI